MPSRRKRQRSALTSNEKYKFKSWNGGVLCRRLFIVTVVVVATTTTAMTTLIKQFDGGSQPPAALLSVAYSHTLYCTMYLLVHSCLHLLYLPPTQRYHIIFHSRQLAWALSKIDTFNVGEIQARRRRRRSEARAKRKFKRKQNANATRWMYTRLCVCVCIIALLKSKVSFANFSENIGTPVSRRKQNINESKITCGWVCVCHGACCLGTV